MGNIKAHHHLCDDMGNIKVHHFCDFLSYLNTRFLKSSNGLRLKNSLYKSCRSQQDLQLCSWNFFQLRLFSHPNTWFKFWISNFQNFQMSSDGKIVYMKVVGPDRYSCEMGYIRHLKVMTKEKYLIIGHMWWCSLVVGGTREAKVVGSNSGNGGKNNTRAYSRKKSSLWWHRWRANTDTCHICDDIDNRL